MLHGREDYQRRVVDLKRIIPEDEPVFLLRGQDGAAPTAVLAWADRAEMMGAAPAVVANARKQAQAMLAWQRKLRAAAGHQDMTATFGKVPDWPSPGAPAESTGSAPAEAEILEGSEYLRRHPEMLEGVEPPKTARAPVQVAEDLRAPSKPPTAYIEPFAATAGLIGVGDGFASTSDLIAAARERIPVWHDAAGAIGVLAEFLGLEEPLPSPNEIVACAVDGLLLLREGLDFYAAPDGPLDPKEERLSAFFLRASIALGKMKLPPVATVDRDLGDETALAPGVTAEATHAPTEEVEVIRKLRAALDLLKEKYAEVEGGWITAEFLTAATDGSHWMHQVAEAERLSAPYLEDLREAADGDAK